MRLCVQRIWELEFGSFPNGPTLSFDTFHGPPALTPVWFFTFSPGWPGNDPKLRCHLYTRHNSLTRRWKCAIADHHRCNHSIGHLGVCLGVRKSDFKSSWRIHRVWRMISSANVCDANSNCKKGLSALGTSIKAPSRRWKSVVDILFWNKSKQLVFFKINLVYPGFPLVLRFLILWHFLKFFGFSLN